MSRTRHKIPTGLTIEDHFITYGALALSLRQFMLLLGGAATGYGGIWQGLADLPIPPRAALALVPPLLALVWALARPGGRPVERWAFVIVRYAIRPAIGVWRPRAPRAADWAPVASSWVGIAPEPRWLPAADVRAAEGADDGQ